MVREFENSWAVILGGSSGLGLASAKKLAAHGMNLVIVHRNPRVELEQLQSEFEAIKILGVQLLSFNADATNPQKRQEIISELKSQLGKAKVKCLLHSIAKGNLKTMTGENALNHDDFSITISAMAISLYDWVKEMYQAELFEEDARILSLTSEGSSRAMPHYAAVSAAKAALEAISRSIALEFAPFGIRSNCIQAGVTDTRSLQMIPGSEKITAFAQNRNPFKRLTKPEDIANAVYLLCRPEASWINGAVLPVDGGERIS